MTVTNTNESTGAVAITIC